MQRRKNKLSQVYESKAFCLLLAVVVGFFVIMGCLFMFSLIVSKIDLPKGALAVFSTIALCVGAFSGGLTCAKRRGKNGLLFGVATGVAMFVVIFVLSLFFARTAVTFTAASKLFWTIVFGAVGGIVGVNSKSRKY